MGYWVAGFATFSYPTLKKICVDGGYCGSFVKRWIVERTFAWLNHSRRLSKDYELTLVSAESLIKISHIHTLLKRL